MKKITFLFLLAFLFGCKPAAKMIYGIKKPMLEDKQSIQAFLQNSKVDITKVLYLRDFKSFISVAQMKLMSFPNALFFNKDGAFVDYNQTPSDCNANVGTFISDLTTFKNSTVDSTKTLNQIIPYVDVDKNGIPQSDITVLITFAKYTGKKLNKEKAFEWVKLLETAKQKGINVNYYLLNCDYQKSWNIPKQLYPKLGIKE